MMPLERLFGSPMAAPETAAMRKLRFAFTGFAMLSGIGVLGIGLLVKLVGPVIAGGALLALIAVSTVLGLIFFIVKTRRDDRWIMARGFDRSGDGA